MDELIVRIGPRGDGATGKRAAIVRAATELFLRHGYQDTSTDQIAAAASVSKQTVYNQFGDKQSLFTDVVIGVTATAESLAATLPQEVADVRTAADLEASLHALGRRYLTTVMNPRVLALRRLLIGEAHHFPDLASTYYQRAPARVLAALADVFGRLADRGLLAAPDPMAAAEDFAFLVLGRPLDHGMFHVKDESTDSELLNRAADRAVSVFLAAYARR